MKVLYHYHPVTCEYIHIVTEADEDPMEPGRYLIPANATDLIPPFSPDGWWTLFDEKQKKWYTEKKPLPPVLYLNLKRAASYIGMFPDVTIKRALKGGI